MTRPRMPAPRSGTRCRPRPAQRSALQRECRRLQRYRATVRARPLTPTRPAQRSAPRGRPRPVGSRSATASASGNPEPDREAGPEKHRITRATTTDQAARALARATVPVAHPQPEWGRRSALGEFPHLNPGHHHARCETTCSGGYLGGPEEHRPITRRCLGSQLRDTLVFPPRAAKTTVQPSALTPKAQHQSGRPRHSGGPRLGGLDGHRIPKGLIRRPPPSHTSEVGALDVEPGRVRVPTMRPEAITKIPVAIRATSSR